MMIVLKLLEKKRKTKERTLKVKFLSNRPIEIFLASLATIYTY